VKLLDDFVLELWDHPNLERALGQVPLMAWMLLDSHLQESVVLLRPLIVRKLINHTACVTDEQSDMWF
jgi:hypothetical protein